MALAYGQTDTTHTYAMFLPTGSRATSLPSAASTLKTIEFGAATGSATYNTTQVNAQTNLLINGFLTVVGNLNATTWEAGTFTARFHVTTANANYTAERIEVWRVDSGPPTPGKQLVGGLDFSVALSATITYTASVTCSASVGATADLLYVLLIGKTTASGSQTITFEPDQVMTLPHSGDRLFDVNPQRVAFAPVALTQSHSIAVSAGTGVAFTPVDVGTRNGSHTALTPVSTGFAPVNVTVSSGREVNLTPVTVLFSHRRAPVTVQGATRASPAFAFTQGGPQAFTFRAE
jgi:hypothetical protein